MRILVMLPENVKGRCQLSSRARGANADAVERLRMWRPSDDVIESIFIGGRSPCVCKEGPRRTQKDAIVQEPDEQTSCFFCFVLADHEGKKKEKKEKWLTSPLRAVSLKTEHLICESNSSLQSPGDLPSAAAHEQGGSLRSGRPAPADGHQPESPPPAAPALSVPDEAPRRRRRRRHAPHRPLRHLRFYCERQLPVQRAR